MLHAPISRIIETWEKLFEAKNDCNPYGGDVAEIYFSRLMPHWNSYAAVPDEYPKEEKHATEGLIELCVLFMQMHPDCKILVEDLQEQTETWPDRIWSEDLSLIKKWSIRVHLKVVAQP